MIQLDLSDHRPLYEQIKEKIKELIIAGVLAADEKIPSVRELAQQLAINPNTIQRAYKDLEAEGYIYSVRAKGSFVAPVSHIRDKTEDAKLRDEFEAMVKQARFLHVDKRELIAAVERIYAETAETPEPQDERSEKND